MKIVDTDEQRRIYNECKFVRGHTKCFIARAGSGKTHTLLELAKRIGKGKRMLVTSFNVNAVKDLQAALAARGMSEGIDCRTLHSLCWRHFTNFQKRRIDIRNPNPTDYIQLVPYYYDNVSRNDELDIASWFCVRTRDWFCSRNYTIQSFVEDLYLTEEEANLGIDKNVLFDVLTAVHSNVITGKNFKGDKYGLIPRFKMSHNAYAKAIQLARPKLDYDIIIVDECQDTNGPCIELINNQENCMKIFAGDPKQQLYEFNGAIDALNAMAVGSTVEYYTLSRSFRCPSQVVEYSNRLLQAMDDGILMRPKLTETVSPHPKTRILAHSNWGVLMYADELCQKGIEYNLDCEYMKIVSEDKNERNQVQYLANEILDLENWYNRRTSNIKTMEVRSCIREFGSIKKAYEFAMKADKGQKQKFSLIMKSKGRLMEVIRDIAGKRNKNADITISTVHKAKGSEWENVVVLSDFPDFNKLMTDTPKRPDARQIRLMDNLKVKRAWESDPNLEIVIDEEQFRIMYVACTRASESLKFQDEQSIPVPTQETLERMKKMQDEGRLRIV